MEYSLHQSDDLQGKRGRSGMQYIMEILKKGKILFVFPLVFLLNSCLIWNIILFKDEQRFMNTGTEVKIHNNTLVIATVFDAGDEPGGYLTIFEYENNKWVKSSTLNMKKYLKQYQAPMYIRGESNRHFLGISDGIIALIASSVQTLKDINNYEKTNALLIFSKHGTEWVLRDTIYNKNQKTRGSSFWKGNYGTDISVYNNDIFIPEIEQGIHIYTVDENEISAKFIPDDIMFYHARGGTISVKDNTLVVSEVYYIDNKYFSPSEVRGRINVYNRIDENWELRYSLDENSHPDIKWAPLIKYVGIIDDNNFYIASDLQIYFFRKDQSGYKINKIIEIPSENKNYGWLLDLLIKDNIMAFITQNKLYLYYNINDNWILNNTIDLLELNKKYFSLFEWRHRYYSDVNIDISNDNVVIGFNNVSDNVPGSDAIVYMPFFPFPPFLFPKNPGFVYIIKILPEGEYIVQDIIVRDYNIFGKVRFKNKLTPSGVFQ
jgi:hypothetical protein